MLMELGISAANALVEEVGLKNAVAAVAPHIMNRARFIVHGSMASHFGMKIGRSWMRSSS
jgi:hypothetical protein